MKKSIKLDRFFNWIGILLVVGFVLRTGADYFTYDFETNALPFSALVIIRALLFLIPSVVCFLVARFMKKKNYSF